MKTKQRDKGWREVGETVQMERTGRSIYNHISFAYMSIKMAEFVKNKIKILIKKVS